jgi:hypothetical protein
MAQGNVSRDLRKGTWKFYVTTQKYLDLHAQQGKKAQECRNNVNTHAIRSASDAAPAAPWVLPVYRLNASLLPRTESFTCPFS